MRQTGPCLPGLRRGQTSGAEEPDEGNLHVGSVGDASGNRRIYPEADGATWRLMKLLN